MMMMSFICFCNRVGWVEGEGKGGVKGLSSRAEVMDKVRGEYRV
jgi:hypothetical protein